MERIRVAVLLGGRSSEHAISCVSGRAIVAALGTQRYEVRVVGIRRDGIWVMADDAGLGVVVDGERLPEISSTAPQVTLEKALDVDVVFPVLHGPWGEDGSVQGLLETMDVPYVGSGVLASGAAMDKAVMKSLLASAGLPVGASVTITDRDWQRDPEGAVKQVEALGLPVFVKPCRAGSSLGISRVTEHPQLMPAILEARRHDPRVIVEAAVTDAREIECGVLVDGSGEPRASRCAEIVVRSAHDFYDFEAKYLDDSADLIVPADLPPAWEARIQELAVRAFDALGCEGLARVDFFVRDDGSVLVNEVNTMPGFTSISMFPRMWAASGVTYADVVDALVADARRKGTGLH